MGGNIPGENFVGIFQGGFTRGWSLMGGSFLGGSFPGGITLEPWNICKNVVNTFAFVSSSVGP